MNSLRDLVSKANLTKTQHLIGEFMLDNSADVCFMTSTEIALALSVSESSVIRFSRSLGFSGYSEFQKFLRKEYQDKVSSISASITVPSQRLKKRAKLGYDSEFLQRHFKNVAGHLESVFSDNSIATFDEAAHTIIQSKHKYITASRGNACLADFFYLYLAQMLNNVVSTNESTLSPFDRLCHIGKDDCVIVFSFPRYSNTDELAIQMASDAGAKIIVISDKQSAALAKYASLLFTVRCDSDTFFNSLIGAQFISEALLDTISHNVKGLDKKLSHIDDYISKTGDY